MRYLELFENEIAVCGRAWIGPNNEIVPVIESHSEMVKEEAAMFGLDQQKILALIDWWENENGDYDYDYIIALAERNGWVRISHDSPTAPLVASGKDLRTVQKAVRLLIDKGEHVPSLDLEIETIVTSGGATRIEQQFYSLDDERKISQFLRSPTSLPCFRRPHISPVELPPEPLSEDVSQPALKRWFGKSKVVDASGKPLVCYHGTFKDFHTFIPGSHFGDAEAANKRLHFLSHSYGYTQTFGGHDGAVMPVYLRIENPLRVIDDGGLADGEDLATAALDAGALTPDEHEFICEPPEGMFLRSASRNTSPLVRARLFKILTGKGYDGIVYKNTVEGNGDSWVPFKPEQIKSAFNKGSFDSSKANISEEFVDVELAPGEANENFEHWFGDSKVVDASGKPLVCYHGTFADFHTFHPLSHFGDIDAANTRIKNSVEGMGHLTRKSFDGANIVPVYLSIKNPLRIIDDGGLIDRYDLAEAAFEAGAISKEEYDSIPKYANLTRTLAKKGYDGLVYENTVEGNGDSWVPLWKHQIKSVYNRGTWSKLRDNITEDEVAVARPFVRDDKGNIKMFFHRSDADFDRFKRINVKDKPKWRMTGGGGFYFSTIKADEFYGTNEYHVALRAANPYQDMMLNTTKISRSFIQKLKDQGYDSIDSPNYGEFIVFDPDQILIVRKNGRSLL